MPAITCNTHQTRSVSISQKVTDKPNVIGRNFKCFLAEGKKHTLCREWMKVQPVCTQRLVRKTTRTIRCIDPIFSITNQRMTDMRKMRTNLMGTTGIELHTQKRKRAACLKNFIARFHCFYTFPWHMQRYAVINGNPIFCCVFDQVSGQTCRFRLLPKSPCTKQRYDL